MSTLFEQVGLRPARNPLRQPPMLGRRPARGNGLPVTEPEADTDVGPRLPASLSKKRRLFTKGLVSL